MLNLDEHCSNRKESYIIEEKTDRALRQATLEVTERSHPRKVLILPGMVLSPDSDIQELKLCRRLLSDARPENAIWLQIISSF